MKNEIEKYISILKDGTKKMFKEFFRKETNKKQRANMWTFIRILIPFITLTLSILAIASGTLALFIASGALAGFGAVTDYFDGRSSRKHESTSEYGKLLDQVSDKFFAGIIGINLLFLNPSYITILIGEATIAAVNIYNVLKHKGIKSSSSKLGKIKEWPLFLTLALGYLSPISASLLTISNISIAITFVVQLLTAKDYSNIYKENLKELKNQNNIPLLDNPNDEIDTNNLGIGTDQKNNTPIKEPESRKEQLQRLRNVLAEILKVKQAEVNPENNDKKIYQLKKQKK